MIIVTSKIEDTKIIDLFKDAKNDCMLSDFQLSVRERIIEYQKLGPVICVEENSVPLGIGGVSKIHKGVGMAWMVISKRFLKRPILLVKSSKNLIEEAIHGMKLHRIQMDIDTTYCENLKFAKSLGFKFEGNMINYGPSKQDYHRYVLLRD